MSAPSLDGALSEPAGIRPPVFAYGFSLRKRRIVRRFLGGAQVRFTSRGRRVPRGGTLLLWGGNHAPAGLAPDVRIVRMEDGFLRSVGLGADLIHPLSLVMDRSGIYFDASRPSDLEHILQTTDFSSDLLERAARLRSAIVKSGLTKYNVGTGGWTRPSGARRVILVPGQVETDASIRLGAPGISTNMGLLKAVREANPDAYVAYKPHPDVVCGLRAKGEGEDQAPGWCDEVVTDVSLGSMMPAVDEVHVLTSLAGFEALLRAKRVVCYGQPFYAGWGLTSDKVRISRRTRRLGLDALVAGALILYPVYVSRLSGRFTTPETALEELLLWKETDAARAKWWRPGLRWLLRKIVRRT